MFLPAWGLEVYRDSNLVFQPCELAMNEHDSLVSHALNNMTLNELANEYARLKIELLDSKRLLLKTQEVCSAMHQLKKDKK